MLWHHNRAQKASFQQPGSTEQAPTAGVLLRMQQGGPTHRNHTNRDRSGLIRHSSVCTSVEMRGCGVLELCLCACPWGWGQICLFLTWGLLNDIKSITSSTTAVVRPRSRQPIEKSIGAYSSGGLEPLMNVAGRRKRACRHGAWCWSSSSEHAHVLRQQPYVREN